jgi:hypothetical protein
MSVCPILNYIANTADTITRKGHMYSIVYIPTGVPLVEIIDDKCMSEDFYSLKDCRKFIRNFLEYDSFQRDKPRKLALCSNWLNRNNRFTYMQYSILFDSLHIQTPFNPDPDSLIREEFIVIKTNRNSRTTIPIPPAYRITYYLDNVI